MPADRLTIQTTTLNTDGDDYARGRNGYFQPATVEAFKASALPGPRGDGLVFVNVYSKRQGKSPPIGLRLTPDNCVRLVEAILDACGIGQMITRECGDCGGNSVDETPHEPDCPQASAERGVTGA